MNRTDAEKALRTFDDYDWNGTTLRVSWSAKPVPIPVQPAYGESIDQSCGSSTESTAATARPAKKLRTEVEDEQDPQIAMAWFEKVSPDRARFIQTVADRIKTHGEEFREMLMEREVDNPQLTFLFDKEVCLLCL
jgi:hypothetical protein